MSPARRVVEKWKQIGVARDDAITGATALLDALERDRGIVLPEAFRELWSLSDGTAAMDDEEFIFWPLDNITSDPSLGPWQGLLVFADCRLGSRHLCLRFDGMRAGAVVDARGSPIETSFEAFLERYLSDPRSV